MYDQTFNFTNNPFNHYSIGDRSKGLKQDADGGNLYIQRNSPGTDKESKWLPSTQSGTFSLILRTYMPGTEIVEQRWRLLSLKRGRVGRDSVSETSGRRACAGRPRVTTIST